MKRVILVDIPRKRSPPRRYTDPVGLALIIVWKAESVPEG